MAPKFTELAIVAHGQQLAVHPYTVRRDDLPKNCPSVEALHAALLREARVDGLFTDVTAAWMRRNGAR